MDLDDNVIYEINEIIEEYDDIPNEDKAFLQEKFKEALQKAGMPEEEISNYVKLWLKGKNEPYGDNFNPTDELMRMWGTNSKDELNVLMESNDIFGD